MNVDNHPGNTGEVWDQIGFVLTAEIAFLCDQ